MRTYETRMVEGKYETKRTCDVCGVVISRSLFDATEVQVTARTGEQYPECGRGEEYCADICIACFTDKVIPALEAIGLKGVVWKGWDS